MEGTWASLGLLASYRETGEKAYLEGALNWFTFLANEIGFQTYFDSITVNYFAFSPKGVKVPNNTTLVLWFLAEFLEITGNPKFAGYDDKLIRFLELCQEPSGELIYEVRNKHYLCYHYNAFEFIDLFNYYKITGNERAKTILEKMAHFLASGVTEIGSVRTDCTQTFPEARFFSGVAGAALTCASSMGFGNYKTHLKRIREYLIKNQTPEGTFVHSTHDFFYLKNPVNWGFLSDKNSYPRLLSFMLNHLLILADQPRMA